MAHWRKKRSHRRDGDRDENASYSHSSFDRFVYSALRAIGIALLVGLGFKFILVRILAWTR